LNPDAGDGAPGTYFQQLTRHSPSQFSNWKLQEVPRMPQLTRFGERALLDQVLQVVGRGRFRNAFLAGSWSRLLRR